MAGDPRNPDPHSDEAVSTTLAAVLMIEHADDVSREALAALFLATAWPTVMAQNQ
jgi:hypothetical protein